MLRLGHCFARKPALRFLSEQLATKTTQNVTSNTLKTVPFIKHKAVGYWQGVIAGMCAGAVIIGGITRLTESGLSMTDWHPSKSSWPANTSEWEIEFAKYKSFPEYKQVHPDIDLEGFKFIFFWEWFHRWWGRSIGLVYAVPYVGFMASGHLKAAGLRGSATALLGVLGCQGAYGWYMVKSGLDQAHLESRADSKIARVSQYRLAGHLSLALILLSGTLRNSLKCLSEPSMLTNQKSSKEALKNALKLARMAPYMTIPLVALSIVSGAFVAGLDAGMVYNNYPHMASDRIIPSDAFVYEPLWRDLLENPTTVQMEHRIITHLTFLSLMSVCYTGFKGRKVLPRSVNFALGGVFAASWTQVILGISTLVLHCPITLSAMHQSGGVVLLSSCWNLLHQIKRLPIK